MLLYVQTWLPLLTITLTAAIFFSVASLTTEACKVLATIENQHMSCECNERMWNLAHRLARCGDHRNYQAIEWELEAHGYPQARQLLSQERVRERLDAICAEFVKPSNDALRTAGAEGFL